MIPDNQQLRLARVRLKRSIQEVAQALGIGRSRLVRIEAGRAGARDSEVITMLAAFYQAAGVTFGETGQVELRSGLHAVDNLQLH